MIFKMIKFAKEKHKGQTRKVSGEPYITLCDRKIRILKKEEHEKAWAEA